MQTFSFSCVVPHRHARKHILIVTFYHRMGIAEPPCVPVWHLEVELLPGYNQQRKRRDKSSQYTICLRKHTRSVAADVPFRLNQRLLLPYPIHLPSLMTVRFPSKPENTLHDCASSTNKNPPETFVSGGFSCLMTYEVIQ